MNRSGYQPNAGTVARLCNSPFGVLAVLALLSPCVPMIGAQTFVPPTATVPLNALQFNGQSAQSVDAPESAPSLFNADKALTVETWVNVSSWTQRFQAIVTKGESWGIVRSDDRATISFRTALPGPAGGYDDLESTISLPLGQWNHIAAVWTGTRKQLFINGTLVADAAFGAGLLANNFSVMIGGNAQFPSRTLQGSVDSVRIWAVARSEAELEQFRLETLRGSEVGLLADWRFNEASGTVALDSSAGQRHGTLRVGKSGGSPLVAPQRVSGLLFAPPSPGELGLYFNNRTSQYPAESGMTPVTAVQQMEITPSVGSGLFDFQQSVTAEFWMKPRAIPSSGSVTIVSGGTSVWEVRYKDTGKLGFYTTNVSSTVPSTDVKELVNKTRIDPGQWTHVAVVWDPVAAEKRIYVNGLLDVSTPVTGTLTNTTMPVTLGLRPGTPFPSDSYYGAVDELRLWRIVRTPAEVFDNHLRQVNGSEPGLSGVWSFTEATGLTAAESSGRSVAGELSAGMSSLNRVDGVALNVPGLESYTLDLDGLTQFVSIADNPTLNGFTSLTLEAWIKPRAPLAPGLMMIVSKGEGGYGLGLDADLYLRYLNSASHLSALKSASKVTADVWNHVAVVVDGVAGTTTFYINGKAAGTHASAAVPNSPGALCIGKIGGALMTNFFHGGIDEVRIWNTARTPTEVLLLAFSELPGTTAGLTGRWSFTEGDGASVADGGGTNNGTVTGVDDDIWQAGPIFPQAPSLPAGLNLVQNPRAAGLWVGEVNLTRVNEVQKAVNGAADAVSPTAKEATIRILLHVDASGQVRLLKDLIVMQTQAEGVPLPPARQVLVTDPSQIHNYQGVVRRGGKLVGLRYSTVAFDFPGFDMTMIGGIGPGVACGGRIDIDKNAPTNPYRHKYHPDHGEGFDIIRVFSLQFDGMPNDPLKAAPGYGVDRITGIYRESIAGLHKITLKTEGAVTLNRVSSVATLNTP